MLSLGAHVVSVEPQPDLALALKETVALNCWEGRATVINAFACIRDKEHCMRERRSVDAGAQLVESTFRAGRAA